MNKIPLFIILLLVLIGFLGFGYYRYYIPASCSSNGGYVCGEILITFNKNFPKKDIPGFIERSGLTLASNQDLANPSELFFDVASKNSLDSAINKLNQETIVAGCKYNNAGEKLLGYCSFKQDVGETDIVNLLKKHPEITYDEKEIFIWNTYLILVPSGHERDWINKLKKYSGVKDAGLHYVIGLD